MGKRQIRPTDAAVTAPPPENLDGEPDPMSRHTISEFERVQIRRIVEESAALAASAARWHREQDVASGGDAERRLSHGLTMAALGALIMQILAWVRLAESAGASRAVLREARDVIGAPDPEAEPAALDTQARALLMHAMDIKGKARRISRHW